MTLTEKEVWVSFKNVITKFLGNTKYSDYINIVGNMLDKFNKLGCLTNLEIHFLNSHLDFFPDNLGDVSKKHGERYPSNEKTLSGSLGYQYDWRLLLVTSTRG